MVASWLKSIINFSASRKILIFLAVEVDETVDDLAEYEIAAVKRSLLDFRFIYITLSFDGVMMKAIISISIATPYLLDSFNTKRYLYGHIE